MMSPKGPENFHISLGTKKLTLSMKLVLTYGFMQLPK